MFVVKWVIRFIDLSELVGGVICNGYESCVVIMPCSDFYIFPS